MAYPVLPLAVLERYYTIRDSDYGIHSLIADSDNAAVEATDE